MEGPGGRPEPFKYNSYRISQSASTGVLPHQPISVHGGPLMSTDPRPVTHARIDLREMRDHLVRVAYIYIYIYIYMFMYVCIDIKNFIPNINIVNYC